MSTRKKAERSRAVWRGLLLVVGWSTGAVLMSGAVLMTGAVPAMGDWLVTAEGERVETRGPWQVKGPTVVFTTKAGVLSSMRVRHVDLDASEAATVAAKEANAAPPPAPPVAAPAAKRPPVLVLTDADVGRGSGNATGIDALIAQLQTFHDNQDMAGAMSLVHWSGVSSDVRQAMSESFAFMFARAVRGMELVPAEADEVAAQEKDGVTYQPNLTVTGKLVVRLDLVEDDGDADRAEVTFLVGEVLGTPRIAAAASRASRI